MAVKAEKAEHGNRDRENLYLESQTTYKRWMQLQDLKMKPMWKRLKPARFPVEKKDPTHYILSLITSFKFN